MTVLNRKEYLKYHQELYDMRKKLIGIGDTVVINNNYWSFPIIGIVSHFTSSGRVAIRYRCIKPNYSRYYYYRYPRNIIILKKSRKKCQ